MKKVILLLGVISLGLFLSGCGMSAMDYYQRGTKELQDYKCQQSIGDLEKASDMELKDEGDWFPIYELELGLSRFYCGDLDNAEKAFLSINQYATLRSNRNVVEKSFELLKSKGNRKYELTEREETLLHYYLGVIYYKKGNYNDAMIEFKKVDYIADGTYSKLPLIALMRGLTYEKLGDEGNALVAYKKLAEQNPKNIVGYILSYQLEKSEGNKEYWKNEIKNKFKINVNDFIKNGNRTITIIESMVNYNSNNKIFVDYGNGKKSEAYFLDVVEPDFDFGKFATGMLKEVGSKLARDAIKNVAASVIPGGGLIAGLILGGDKGEDRSWILPRTFYIDIKYLPSKSYKEEITLVNDGDVEKEKSVILDNDKYDLFITNL